MIKKNAPDHALVVGVPAKQVGWVCKCGVTLKIVNGFAKCNYCGNEYTQHKNGIKLTNPDDKDARQ